MAEHVEEIVATYRDVEPAVTVEAQILGLDAAAKSKASRTSIVAGVLGVLLLGVGMSLPMTASDFFTLGIVVGVIGLAIAAVAYPIYTKKLSRERDYVRPQILELASQLPESSF